MPKNVLVLMCDHHRFDALSCRGNPLAHTPNLDRLASESVCFDSCYNQSPVCAPARHALATGRYCHANGVITNHHKPFPGMTTIAHALQPLGMRRINIGHMHWTDPDMDNGYEPWLQRTGFNEALAAVGLGNIYEWEAQGRTRRRTGGPSPRTRDLYHGHFDARNAIAQIENAVANNENFLCWTAFSEPHPPFYPPKDIYERFDIESIRLPSQAPEGVGEVCQYIQNKRREWAHLTPYEIRQVIAGYYGLIALVDEYIGQVLETLDRLGIRDDTAVIWTVDHGDQMWEHEMFLKFCMYEASVHVPLMVSVPGVAPARRDELVEHIDLFPTICDLVGADCPDTVHGSSLIPLLRGNPVPADWRDAVFSQIGNVRMIRTRDWKLNTYDGKPGELYDLRADPNEFDNLIGQPECADTAAELDDRLRTWQKQHEPT